MPRWERFPVRVQLTTRLQSLGDRHSMEEEYTFTCPSCWQSITMLLDTSLDDEQTYVEDCEVCCRPIQITFTVEQGEITAFDAEPAQH